MTADAQQADVTVMEASGVSLMARVRYPNGDYATIATTTSITRRVEEDGVTSVTNVTQVVSNVIFDAIQTNDARWIVDTTGYNFKNDVDDDIFVEGDTRYKVFYIIEPVAMARTVLPPFRVHVRDIPGE